MASVTDQVFPLYLLTNRAGPATVGTLDLNGQITVAGQLGGASVILLINLMQTSAGVGALDAAQGSALAALIAAKADATATTAALAAEQATLVSASNIKTINGATLLGTGDMTVSGSSTPLTITASVADATPTIINCVTSRPAYQATLLAFESFAGHKAGSAWASSGAGCLLLDIRRNDDAHGVAR